MSKRELTGNERRVLYGLVQRPTLNDRELSEALGIKVSTVTAVRRRLRRADYFVTRRVPMMHRLGWELLVAGYGQLPLERGVDGIPRMREVLDARFPTVFHVVQSTDHFVFLAAAPDYTSFAREFDGFRTALHRAGLTGDTPVHATLFPLSLTVLGVFFDFSRVLASAFGIDERRSVSLGFEKVGDVDLTRKETEVLKGLVRYPEWSDKAVAAKIKASRQAVSKMRRKFQQEGILRTLRVPSVRNLGFEVVGSVFTRFSPGVTVRARMEGIEKVVRAAPVFFYASTNSETALLGAAKSFEEVSELRAAFVKFADARSLPMGEPTILVGLASMTEVVRNCDFSALVQLILESGSSRR